jgi:hypothetical protein
MKERGRYQIQCMKTRTSTGNGQNVELEYNVETMRITDLPEESSPVSSFKRPNVYDSIKPQSKVISNETVDPETGEVSKITAEVQSSKLKSMLAQIKGS